jgi:outer membrane protein assembly factor BamB
VQAFSADGLLLWQQNVGEDVGVAPVMDNSGVLYLGTVKGRVFAMATDSHGPCVTMMVVIPVVSLCLGK